MARYDPPDYLKTEEDIKSYLETVFEKPMDRQIVTHRLNVDARARKMKEPAKKSGATRASLYKALSAKGNPSLGIVAKIAGASVCD